jgi:NTE family protein
VRTTEFDIAPSRAQALFSSGKGAADKFLSSWDFQRYKQRFRNGTSTGRRETVARAPAQQPA